MRRGASLCRLSWPIEQFQPHEHARRVRGGHRLAPPSNRSPSKRSLNTSASSGLAKQNTTNSPSSQRREYGRGPADRVCAKLHTISLFLAPRTLSAARATWYGHLRLI